MISTLPERLRDAMKGPPKVTAVAIARHCAIAPPSVHGWLSGKSKTIEGANLVRTAELLRVNPKWLAEGVGPKWVSTDAAAVVAQEHPAPYFVRDRDPNIAAAVDILRAMPAQDRRGAVAVLRTYAQNLGPPIAGQALHVAG